MEFMMEKYVTRACDVNLAVAAHFYFDGGNIGSGRLGFYYLNKFCLRYASRSFLTLINLFIYLNLN